MAGKVLKDNGTEVSRAPLLLAPRALFDFIVLTRWQGEEGWKSSLRDVFPT